MKKIALTVLTCAPLMLTACSQESADTEQAATAEKPASPLAEQANTWTEETKKLGETAWDATKETAAEVAEETEAGYNALKEDAGQMIDDAGQAGSDIYEAAKETGSEVIDATTETVGDAYESTKESANELYDAAKEQGGELMQEEAPATEQVPELDSSKI